MNPSGFYVDPVYGFVRNRIITSNRFYDIVKIHTDKI